MATKQELAQTKYEMVAAVANPAVDEGLNRPRSVLLLWFLRNVVGFDDLDAYEYVCDGTDDRGADGLYLESPLGDDDVETLVLLQSKYPETPKNVGETDVATFIGYANHFSGVEALESLLENGPIEPQLKALIERLGIREKLEKGKLRVRLVFVTAGLLEKKAHQLVEATNAAHGQGYITTYDLDRLAPICAAYLAPQPIEIEIDVEVPESRRFVVDVDGRSQIVAAIPAREIVEWPGIEDRSLFDLNVRKQLRPNRVSRSFRKALEKKADHPNFLAFHNGLTVVSNSIEIDRDKITLRGVSVVNGAQSVLALKDREDFLTEDLLMVVKFVEIGNHIQVAREVAWRSNSQNPVNARNLRALSGIQLRLLAEFEANYPEYVYVTRPDASAQYSGKVIQNDAAAQLLCAVYARQPWLAVKLLALFEEENYTTIFRDTITAAHVVMVDRIRQAVEDASGLIPSEYLGAKKLTQMVMVYLVAELLRADAANEFILTDPSTALEDSEALDEKLKLICRHAAGSLAARAEEFKSDETFDDYKIDFKNREVLLTLAATARKQYAYALRLQA